MRYIVSKFCEGCSQTKLFLARGDFFFPDKYSSSAVPTFNGTRIDAGIGGLVC